MYLGRCAALLLCQEKGPSLLSDPFIMQISLDKPEGIRLGVLQVDTPTLRFNEIALTRGVIEEDNG
jgi:hypothetical protein